MNNPKISIITITYNSEKTLEETILSVVNQNYDNIEYIIIDGGSKDGTLDIVEKYNNKVSVVVSESDKGISDAFNKGIKNATGDIIGIINSDDFLADGALQILAQNYKANIDVLYGNVVICDENGKSQHILKSKEDLSTINYQFCITHPATFVSKKAYEKFGVFSLDYKCAMDYDLLLRFYKRNAKFKYIDENLAIFRMGGVNQQMRRKTIGEVRDVSIKYGGNPIIAYFHYYKKIVVDKVKPILLRKNINLKNKRVKSI